MPVVVSFESLFGSKSTQFDAINPLHLINSGTLNLFYKFQKDKGNAYYYLFSKNNSALMEKACSCMGNYSYLV